jgi:EmrB/QacA subfamily drug resistance transporter
MNVVASPAAARRRRQLVLAICCISVFMMGIDGSGVNVALPSIHTDLGTSIAGLQWTVDIYTLGVAALLMFSGSMGDRFGRRRVFLIGLALFTSGSLLCGLAPSLGWLIAFRAVQAAGGSALNPVAMSIIRSVFDDPKERSRAVGLWGATIGISIALGPLIGGALVQSAGWRYIFFVNIPVGVAAYVLAAKWVPESRAPQPRPIDPVGQLLMVILFASLTCTIIQGAELGWLSPVIVALTVTWIIALVALPIYELHHTAPLLDPRFFRNVSFSSSTVIAIGVFAALAGAVFLGTLYLQTVRGLSPLTAGLYALPNAVGTALFSTLTGRYLGRHGVRLPYLVTGIGLIISALLFVTADAHSALWKIACAYAVLGISLGTANPAITTTALSSIPADQAGIASAIASLSRQLGSSLGVAIAGAVVASRLTGELGTGLVHADRPAWLIIAGLGVVTIVLALTTTWRSPISASISQSPADSSGDSRSEEGANPASAWTLSAEHSLRQSA